MTLFATAVLATTHRRFTPEPRTCANPDCGNTYTATRVNQRYCTPACRPTRRPGNTTTRGYGAQHRRERQRWEPIVEAGRAQCAESICLMPSRVIHPGDRWELAHTPDRTGYLGPAHYLCNRKEPQHRGRADEPRRWPIYEPPTTPTGRAKQDAARWDLGIA